MTKLGELGEVNRGRSRHRPRDAAHLYGGPFPFVQTGDIKGAEGLITAYRQTYSVAGLAQSRLWPSGTMCITIAANIAETALLSFPACFPDSVVGFIGDTSKCDIRFVEYVFRKLRSTIQNEASGSVQDNINLATLERLRIPVPPLEEQREIADILGSLDDKIRLLHQQNGSLEAVAQAIFKSWFVDFDPVQAKAEGREPEGLDAATAALFPSGFEDKSFPRGWKIEPITKVSDVIYGAAFASKEFKTDGSGVPLIRIRDLKTMQPTVSTTEVHPKGFLVPPGDVVVGMDGEFRSYHWLGEVAWLNQRVCVFKPTSSANRVFVRESLRPLLADIERGQVGTTVIHIGKTDIDRFKVLTAPQAIMDRFADLTEPLLAKVVCNSETARTLVSLRDSLLPKLVSGKLRILEAEKMAEEIG